LKGVKSLMVDRGWIEQVRNRWPIQKKNTQIKREW
jgi:hypothetical protein